MYEIVEVLEHVSKSGFPTA